MSEIVRYDVALENITQIDCNNPNIDWCVETRFAGNDNPLEVTSAGLSVVADETDGVPFACPLTQEPDSPERSVENFIRVCSDCPHSFISRLVSIR